MSTKSNNHSKKVTHEKILRFVRNHEEPVVTATEIAAEFDMTNSGVIYRLEQLEEDGKIVSKEAGASAKVWYPPEFVRVD